MTRAAIYVRISSDPEGRALGVKHQEADCRKLAGARGWDVAEVYSDNDISAASGRRRPAWERMLADIDAGRVDAVVAYSASRMYRRVADLGTFIDLAQARGLDVATVASGNVDLTTADGRMQARILASIDQGEAERVSERTSRFHAAAAADGKVHGSLGYGFDGTAVVPEEADAIRDAARRVLAGESLSSVAAVWNAAGRRTRRDKPWTAQMLRRVLLSPRIAGLRVHRDTTYPAVWPAIVDARTWGSVVEVLEDPSRVSPPTRGRYLLSGLIRCAECGARLKGQPARGVPAYMCARSAGGCGRVRIMAAGVEEYVSRAAADHPVGDVRSVPDPGDIEPRLLAAIDAEEAKLVKLNAMRLDEGMSVSEYAKTAAPIRARLAALEAELADATGPPPPAWSRLYDDVRVMPDTWAEFITDPANRADVRADIERKVDRVDVRHVGKGGRWIPVTDRVRIAWR